MLVKQLKMKQKKKKEDLGSSLLGNLLTGKGTIRAGERTIRAGGNSQFHSIL